ncbi:SRPBCC family protein [Trujillonella endophytica]|uniref:Carbon monoxide dehydrogenase subunit G n=1 Tax=Trujillonella endophytica TaxID=673521 RepID=A0A1H8PV98_9ACTN|nr:SRPBCC family protein [Trujillella endophytica]SEO45691.1 Carbon monoxide dehydrogenase subunit G [Trujillella endophytica]
MPRSLRAVDLDFTTTAKHRVTVTEVLPASPDAVFAALAEDPAGWAAWFPGFTDGGRYLTPGPHGVGSQREVFARGSRFLETILAWEPGRRWAFRVDEAGLPAVRALAENFTLTPEGAGTRVDYTMAQETSPGFAGGLIIRVAGGQLRKALRNLGAHLAATEPA